MTTLANQLTLKNFSKSWKSIWHKKIRANAKGIECVHIHALCCSLQQQRCIWCMLFQLSLAFPPKHFFLCSYLHRAGYKWYTDTVDDALTAVINAKSKWVKVAVWQKMKYNIRKRSWQCCQLRFRKKMHSIYHHYNRLFLVLLCLQISRQTTSSRPLFFIREVVLKIIYTICRPNIPSQRKDSEGENIDAHLKVFCIKSPVFPSGI